jgi:hypothetical protein
MMMAIAVREGIQMTVRIAVAIVLAVLVAFVQPAHAATAKQQSFASPQDAVQALVTALRADDTKSLTAILGPKSKPLLESGDPVADREVVEDFLAAYDVANQIQQPSDTQAILATGNDDWPFPIPLVKETAGWRFDTEAGDEEVIARRVGRNELSTIQAALAFVDAQREYYETNPAKSKLLHYASKFVSTEGKRDGLYYPTAEGEPESPLGSLFAKAKSDGYKREKGKPTPFHGYYYRMLDGQGPHATGGAYDYFAKGVMLGGFALVAYPANYDNSGVMTFIVNQDGAIYQKDLGPKTASIAGAIKRFDPDDTWERVPDPDQDPANATAEAAEAP